MTDKQAFDAVTPAGHGLRLEGYRNILAVVAGLAVLQAAMAALAIVVTLNLSAAGVPNTVLGFVTSCFAAGFLLGTLLSPREITRIGHIRAYAMFAAIAAIAVLGFGFGVSVAGWCLIQVILGTCCAGLLTSGESWVSSAAPRHQSGAILSFYHMVSKTGAIIGPFAIAAASFGAAGFMITAALFAASLIPITTTSRAQPQLSTANPFGPRRILKHAPAAALSAFTAGAVNNAVAQLYPVFAASFENGGGFVAQFNAALLSGAIVGLWPSGLASDHFDRRLVIAGLSLLGAGAAAGLIWSASIDSTAGVLIAAFAFGAGSLSHYAVAVAHAADRATHAQATSMMAGILMIWGVGSVAGPVLAGFAMSFGLGSVGLFLFAAAMLGLLAISMFTRAVRAAPVPGEDKEPFRAVPATTYVIAEFDPRGDDEQLDLFSERTKGPPH